MTLVPEYTTWSQVIELIEQATQQQQHQVLLAALLTPDERDALIARVNILAELMKNELSQRQISQLLGVGIATVTRGSSALKSGTETEIDILRQLILTVQPEEN